MFLFAGLIILHQFLIQPALIRLLSDAPAINIAGRQRMLSQKLVKAALALRNDRHPSSSAVYRTELANTLDLWRTSHQSLVSNQTTYLSSRKSNSEIQQGFREIEPHFQAMAHAAEVLLNQPDEPNGQAALDDLLQNESAFLTGMHNLVGLYENEARRHVHQLQNMGLAIMVVILGVQLVMQFIVMRPELTNVSREWDRREADYALLVELMTDGLVVFDAQGRVEFSNGRFGSMVGTPVDQLIGKPASIFIVDGDRGLFEKLLIDDIERQQPVDLRLQSPNGDQVEVMISPRRITDHDRRLQKLLLVVTDITTRNSIERRSRELQSQLAHADRLKSMGVMAAALAHELNQPLGAISNYAEGCLARLSTTLTDPQELVSPIRAILKSAHRGGEIVRRTRNFVRNRPYSLSEESINELVVEVMELCRPEARKRGVTFEADLENDLPRVCIDGIQIQQVLANLIQNAFTALERIEPYRRRIKLTSKRTPECGLEISVADTGPGLPNEDATSLFVPFVSSDENGTGLGLAISSGIVEAHGGRIWYEHGPDGGAIFRFVLPSNSDLEPQVSPMEYGEHVHAG